MFDSNQTIRVAKDGKNVKAALAWLRWLTTSDYGKKWIPGQDQAASPIKGAKAPTAQLAQATVSPTRREGAELFLVLPEVPQRSRAGPRDNPPGILRGTDHRLQTLDALDAEYTKIVNASK